MHGVYSPLKREQFTWCYCKAINNNIYIHLFWPDSQHSKIAGSDIDTFVSDY